MRFALNATTGELYEPAMEIREKAEADAYFKDLVAFGMAHGLTRKKAESIQRANLGYFAGYYDAETQARVNRLFRTEHPVFGAEAPTPKEALAVGGNLARRKEGTQR